MISYALVMIVSLATGQPTHAFVEGPMSDSWCVQLIQREGYSGQHGGHFRVASCLRWPDAQLELAQNSCRLVSAPDRRTRRRFDCVTPGGELESAAVADEQASPSLHGSESDSAPAPASGRVTTLAAASSEAASASLPASAPAVLPAPAGAGSNEPPVSAAPTVSTTADPSSAPVPFSASLESTAPPDGQASLGDQRRSHLGMAAAALVAQAHTQARAGKDDLAEETLERALRIEPDNPVLWVELGQLWMSKGDAVQADGTGRRALALAAGDRPVQATAWRLIAESLRARGRNQEAVDADRRAASASSEWSAQPDAAAAASRF